MNKATINCVDWIRLNDMCDILRHIEENPVFENTDKVMKQIASLMFYDEIQNAKTDEEREALREFPGEFIVVKNLGYKNPNGKSLIFFMEFSEGEGKAVDDVNKAMVFMYRSMADHVAETLGTGWRTICLGREYGKIMDRVLGRFEEIPDSAEEDEEEPAE